MGYTVELNTLLRPPQSFDFSSLSIGTTYTVVLERERAFPLHIAILVIDRQWNFYGYAVTHKAEVTQSGTTVTFEMLIMLSPEDRIRYRENFLAAARKTGEA